MNRRDFLSLTGAAAAGASLAPHLLAASKADYTLRIGPVSAEIAKGKVIKTTGYNGTIPGPMLRMKEGKPVTIDVFNDTTWPELVHWHGLNVSTKADGAEEEGSPYVMPKGQLRVNFTPNPAGNRWYHTHIMAMDDLTKGAYNGQYGHLYIEPKKGDPGKYDQELFLAARHWEPKILHRGDPQNDWTVDYDSATLGTHCLGHGEPVRVKKGQRVLFYFLNASATRDINLALPGHKFHVIALDGNPVPNPADVDVLQLVVAERVDAVVEMNNPGVWILGATNQADRNKGLGIVIEYENEKGEPKWTNPPNTPWDYTLFADKTAAARPVEDKFELSFHMMPDPGKPFNIWMVNEKTWPNVDFLKVKKGKRYRVIFKSGHEDGHPLHLHRHNFEVVKVGDKVTSGLIKDTVRVPRDGTCEVEFIADNPGDSLLHCHMQHHMDYGFKTMVKYI